jgi:iron complex transport system substrate-binding protein
MNRITAIGFILLLIACPVCAAITGDLDGDGIVSEAELGSLILGYLDGSEDVRLDELRESAHIHRYYPRTIIDDSAEPATVTIYKPVKRIIVLHSNGAEILRTLNSSDKIIGISKHTADCADFFPQISRLPMVGSMTSPDIERIISLNPDVVIAYGSHFTRWSEELEKKLHGTDITLIRLDCYKPETMIEDVRKLGCIIERENEAEEFAGWYLGYLGVINDRVRDLSVDEKPRVYIEGYDDYKTYGRGSGAHQLVEMAGGRNIAAGLSGSYMKVDPEWVVVQNPDIIVKVVGTQTGALCGYGTDDPAEMRALRDEIMSRPELADVNAVRDGRVYLICASGTWTNPKYLIGLTYLTGWFHPELFEDLDPEAIHQEYLSEFQGLKYNLSEHGVFVYPEMIE